MTKTETGFALEALETRLQLAAGELDPTFGAGGVVLNPVPLPSTDAAVDSVVQPDGKLLVLGQSTSDLGARVALARYAPSGEPDSTFGSDGLALPNIGSASMVPRAMALQDGGSPELAEEVIWLLHEAAQERGIDCLVAGFDARGPPPEATATGLPAAGVSKPTLCRRLGGGSAGGRGAGGSAAVSGGGAIMNDVLTTPSRLVRRAALADAEMEGMYRLLTAHFENVSMEQFRRDLLEKNWVILIEREGRLVGFTTLLVYETTEAGEVMTVVYSGDTIVAPEAWNSSALPRAWIESVAKLREAFPNGRCVWMLITSGFRAREWIGGSFSIRCSGRLSYGSMKRPHWG